jgi:protease I
MKHKLTVKTNLLVCIITIAYAVLFISVQPLSAQQKESAAKNSVIQLPAPKLDSPVSLEKALATRRSIRQFTDQPFTMEQVGQLAWAGQGITEKTRGLRTAPSARATFPIKLYLATHTGLYLYIPDKHALEVLAETDVRQKLSRQPAVTRAGCDIIIVGRVRNTSGRYGNRAEKWVLLEAGHIAQNILLEAVSLGLGAVPVGGFADPNEVGKICSLPQDQEPLYMVAVGFPQSQRAEQKETEKAGSVKMETRKNKKAIFIIAGKNFRDEELFETKKVLEKAGIETNVASSKTGSITGMLGGKAEAKVLLKDVNVDDYDAVVFIGGIGAQEYFNDQTAQGIAKSASDKKKVLAAICIAPSILANAGLLKGHNATSFASEGGNLVSKGANYTNTDVEQDGLIITGNGPSAAEKFGKTIVKALEKQQ